MTMPHSNTMHLCSDFTISCGTITLDTTRQLVLVVRDRGTGRVYLPKGRKHLGETLEQAALRATLEETGCFASLLALDIPSMATTPGCYQNPAAAAAAARNRCTEPLAVAQRVANDVLKMIFWFAAKANSTTTRADCSRQTDGNSETIWLDWASYQDFLTSDDDKKMVASAVTACSQIRERSRPSRPPIFRAPQIINNKSGSTRSVTFSQLPKRSS